MPGLARLLATRYVTPFREGGSVPALVETDDERLFVVKLAGAGQGRRALCAELIAGEIARAFGLRVPELAFVTLDEALSRTERDQEIQDLLRASVGLNLGLEYLGSALMYDPAARMPVDPELASRIVALDAFVMNVDRTARNPNLLWWQNELWLIDHGAALYFHHSWDGGLSGSDRPFPQSKDHVLLPYAAALPEAGTALVKTVDDALLARVTELCPEEWLAPRSAADYAAYLGARRDAASRFIEEAVRARAQRV